MMHHTIPSSRLLPLHSWWVLLLMLGGMQTARAQEYRMEWGAWGSVNSYLGDANKVIPFATLGGGAGIQMRYNHNFRLAFSGDLSLNLLQGSTRVTKNVFPEVSDPIRFTAHTLLLATRGEYNFFAYSDKYPFLHTKRWSPYIALGLNVGVALGKGTPVFLPGIEGAVGVKYKFANRWNLIASLGGRHFFADKLDTLGTNSNILSNPYHVQSSWYKGGDGMIMITLGVTYEFSSRGSSCNMNEQIAR